MHLHTGWAELLSDSLCNAPASLGRSVLALRRADVSFIAVARKEMGRATESRLTIPPRRSAIVHTRDFLPNSAFNCSAFHVRTCAMHRGRWRGGCGATDGVRP